MMMCVCRGIVLSLELISYELQPSPYTQLLMTLVAYFFAFRGVWSLAVILYTNKSEKSLAWMLPVKRHHQDQMGIVENVLAEGLTLKPHLNTALRAEILFFTTQGTTHSHSLTLFTHTHSFIHSFIH